MKGNIIRKKWTRQKHNIICLVSYHFHQLKVSTTPAPGVWVLLAWLPLQLPRATQGIQTHQPNNSGCDLPKQNWPRAVTKRTLHAYERQPTVMLDQSHPNSMFVWSKSIRVGRDWEGSNRLQVKSPSNPSIPPTSTTNKQGGAGRNTTETVASKETNKLFISD